MEDVDKNKKLYILSGILLIVALAIATNFIRKNLGSDVYNTDIKNRQDLLNPTSITYDREIYYTIDNILTEFVSSYSIDDSLKASASYEEYYDVLSKSYKDKLGKKQYKEKAETFFKRLEYTTGSEMDKRDIIVSRNIIRSIFDIGDDMYVCSVGIINKNDIGYIGIKLNKMKNTYEIFYLD